MKKSMLRVGSGIIFLLAAIFAGTLIVPFSAQAGASAPDLPVPAILQSQASQRATESLRE